ncbi:MAG: PAS domain S-box protein [Ferruginibacter sp.]
MENLVSPGSELFAFFEMTPDLVCIAGKDGYWKKINSAVINKLGYSAEELYASPISSFIYHEDKDQTKRRRNELLEGKVLHNFINRYLTKQGHILWLEWTSIYFSDNEYVFAIAKDVTERKQMEREVEEQYLKYKGLATHFKTSIEKDRKYLAYELHEALAQLVAAVKMDIDWIATNETGLPASSKSRIEHAVEISKLLINTIQRISFSISPNMLDDFGLNITLEWLCKEFAILNKIPCNFEAAYNEDELAAEMKIDFLRFFQEALTNIIDVSRAGKVVIGISDQQDKFQLCISDEGDGIDLDTQRASEGLINMRERAAFVNGAVTIKKSQVNGTMICVLIPK